MILLYLNLSSVSSIFKTLGTPSSKRKKELYIYIWRNGGIGIFPSAAIQLKHMSYVTHLLIRLQIFSALSTERKHNVLIHVVPMADLAKYPWHAVNGLTAF